MNRFQFVVTAGGWIVTYAFSSRNLADMRENEPQKCDFKFPRYEPYLS